ncbi:hypothetical protein FGO68_gene5563 [Halteria grandinella]|uniref:Uncharacterized protein n=1 Tax=Halteria grandinella TaxID=5974 RepID=A0A8J8P715_HALGN|nr:hypothetical protein FGO68_gene5563 [Halteria grandinella]
MILKIASISSRILQSLLSSTRYRLNLLDNFSVCSFKSYTPNCLKDSSVIHTNSASSMIQSLTKSHAFIISPVLRSFLISKNTSFTFFQQSFASSLGVVSKLNLILSIVKASGYVGPLSTDSAFLFMLSKLESLFYADFSHCCCTFCSGSSSNSFQTYSISCSFSLYIFSAQIHLIKCQLTGTSQPEMIIVILLYSPLNTK